MIEPVWARCLAWGKVFFLGLGINRLIEIRISETVCFYVAFISLSAAYCLIVWWLIFSAPLYLSFVSALTLIGIISAAFVIVLMKMEYPDRKRKRKAPHEDNER